MKHAWNAYKISALLYFAILMLPVGIYTLYDHMERLEEDTEIAVSLSMLEGKILVYAALDDDDRRRKDAEAVERDIAKLRPWFQSQERPKYYIGVSTLKENFSRLERCWRDIKREATHENLRLCHKLIKSIDFSLYNMIHLKQEHLKNILYIVAIVATIILIFLIFLIRNVLYTSLKKDDIHDEESQLYNREYCLVALGKRIDMAKRHKHDLSVLLIHISQEGASGEKYAEVMKKVGGLINAVTRSSDIPCRLSRDTVAITLPYTDAQKSRNIIERLQSLLEEFKSENVKFDFETLEYERDGNPRELVERIKSIK